MNSGDGGEFHPHPGDPWHPEWTEESVPEEAPESADAAPSDEPSKPRRGLFRRKSKKETAEPEAEPENAPEAEPEAEEGGVPPVFAEGAEPVGEWDDIPATIYTAESVIDVAPDTPAPEATASPAAVESEGPLPAWMSDQPLDGEKDPTLTVELPSWVGETTAGADGVEAGFDDTLLSDEADRPAEPAEAPGGATEAADVDAFEVVEAGIEVVERQGAVEGVLPPAVKDDASAGPDLKLPLNFPGFDTEVAGGDSPEADLADEPPAEDVEVALRALGALDGDDVDVVATGETDLESVELDPSPEAAAAASTYGVAGKDAFEALRDIDREDLGEWEDFVSTEPAAARSVVPDEPAAATELPEPEAFEEWTEDEEPKRRGFWPFRRRRPREDEEVFDAEWAGDAEAIPEDSFAEVDEDTVVPPPADLPETEWPELVPEFGQAAAEAEAEPAETVADAEQFAPEVEHLAPEAGRSGTGAADQEFAPGADRFAPEAVVEPYRPETEEPEVEEFAPAAAAEESAREVEPFAPEVEPFAPEVERYGADPEPVRATAQPPAGDEGGWQVPAGAHGRPEADEAVSDFGDAADDMPMDQSLPAAALGEDEDYEPAFDHGSGFAALGELEELDGPVEDDALFRPPGEGGRGARPDQPAPVPAAPVPAAPVDEDEWVTGPIDLGGDYDDATVEMPAPYASADDITEQIYTTSATTEHRGFAEELDRFGEEDTEWQAISAAMPGVGTGVVGFDDVADLGDEEDVYEAPTRSELGTRVITGVVLVGFLLGTVWVGGGAAAAFIGLLVALGLGEFYGTLRHRGFRPLALFGYIGGVGLYAATWFHGPIAIPIGIGLAGVMVFFVYAFAPMRRDALTNGGLTVLGIAWVMGTAAFAIPILRSADYQVLLLSVVVVTAAMDIGAYSVGRTWGRRALAPVLSPNKSVEGLIGGIATCMAAAAAIGYFVDPFDLRSGIALGLVICVAAPIGDLAESMVKRSLGVKDMGAVLPGHGGILDRIDAFLFVIPAAWVLFMTVGLLG